MLDFPRWKVIWIILVLGLGVALAIPSLLPEAMARQLGLGGLPRINLGLDLSGGSRLLLEAETSDIAKLRLEQMEEQVRTEMQRSGSAHRDRRYLDNRRAPVLHGAQCRPA